jgi:hypothetical protein
MTAKVFETAAQNGVPKWRKQPKRQTKALVVEALNTLFNKPIARQPNAPGHRTTFNTASQLPDSCTYRIAGVCAEGG